MKEVWTNEEDIVLKAFEDNLSTLFLLTGLALPNSSSDAVRMVLERADGLIKDGWKAWDDTYK